MGAQGLAECDAATAHGVTGDVSLPVADKVQKNSDLKQAA